MIQSFSQIAKMLQIVHKRLLRTNVLLPKFLSTETFARGHGHQGRFFSNGGQEVADNQKQSIGNAEVKPKSVWEIPGIPILPLVGSWPFLMFNKDWNYHDLPSFHRACFAKYGRIFRLHNPGGGNQVFISDIGDIQKLFHTPSVAQAPQRAHYDALIRVRTQELRRIFQEAGMTFSTGKEWTRVRTVFNQWLLREQHHLEAELTDEVTKEFCDRIIRIRDPVSFQVPCNFIEELMSWSMEALSYALLGLRQRHVAEDFPRDSPAGRVIAGRCPSIIALEKTEYRPQLWKYFKTRAYKTLEELSNEALRFNNNLINTRLNQLEEDPSLRRDTLLEKAYAHPHLTDGDVHSSLHNLLGAGMEVTPHHTSKLLYCLAKHPEVQHKLRVEVDSTLGDNMPVGEAITSRMPYLRAVVKESLRFLPTSAVTNRILSEPVVLSNYRIPAGWSVAVPMMLLGLDEKNVRRSKEFIPERFIGRDNELAPLPYSYLPFSYGRRQCVGKKIAEVMMRTLAARIVQKFEVEYNHGDLSQVSHITLQLRGPLNFTFRDRRFVSANDPSIKNMWASLE